MIDRRSRELVVTAIINGRPVRRSAPLPTSFSYSDWHEISISRRGNKINAEVSDAGLSDPVAEVDLAWRGAPPNGPVTLLAERTAADFDDLTVAHLFEPVVKRVPDPELGAPDPAFGDEFDGELGDHWSWVRTPTGTIDDGRLRLPVQLETLIDQRPKPDDTASVLLRDAPPGEWTVETKITVPFGDSLPYGPVSAGLIAYAGDDNWVLAGLSSLNAPRYVSFGTESTSYDGTARYAFAPSARQQTPCGCDYGTSRTRTTANTSINWPPVLIMKTGSGRGATPSPPVRSHGSAWSPWVEIKTPP